MATTEQETRLRPRQHEVQIMTEAKDFSLLQNIHNASGMHQAYLMGTGVLSWGQSGWGMKITTHLHLLPRLR